VAGEVEQTTSNKYVYLQIVMNAWILTSLKYSRNVSTSGV
jgi:hypothetical protein